MNPVNMLIKKEIELMVKNSFQDTTLKYLENGIEEVQMSEIKSIPFKLPRCINHHLEGKKMNGVEFGKKVFKIHGVYVEGVFPIFDGIKIVLSENMDVLYKRLGNTDPKFYRGTMKEATKVLKEKLEEYPDLKKQFTKQQLDDIYAEKEKIAGKIWHHYEELGEGGCPVMQLVDDKQHAICKHTGGSYTWNEKMFERKYGDDWRRAKMN